MADLTSDRAKAITLVVALAVTIDDQLHPGFLAAFERDCERVFRVIGEGRKEAHFDDTTLADAAWLCRMIANSKSAEQWDAY